MLNSVIAGVPIECCIYNASGPRTGSVEALGRIADSQAGAVLCKSATLNKQDGNPLPRFVNKVQLGDRCQGSLNSEGLPNAGIDYYIAKETTDAIATFGKPFIVSLSGLGLSDNLEMLNRLYDNPSNIAAIELNLACPNIPGKPVVSNDFEQMENVLRGVTEHPNYGMIPLGIKLGPYFDMPFFERAADIIAQYPIRFVVCINTIGNALFVDADNECVAIAPQNGLGGLGGGFVKQTALANVRTMYQLLTARDRADIDIIGVGGVCTGRDAFELILCGARAVQTATCYWNEGPACFGRIASELEDIMRSKGYHSIEDFRGKLKPYIKPARAVKSSGEVNEGVDLDRENVRPGTGRAAKEDNTTETKKKNSHAQAQQQLPWRELAIFAYLVLFAIIVAFGVENHKKHGHALKDSVW